MWDRLEENAKVLIVAKCNVNQCYLPANVLILSVLIVAKCNVNADKTAVIKQIE